MLKYVLWLWTPHVYLWRNYKQYTYTYRYVIEMYIISFIARRYDRYTNEYPVDRDKKQIIYNIEYHDDITFI